MPKLVPYITGAEQNNAFQVWQNEAFPNLSQTFPFPHTKKNLFYFTSTPDRSENNLNPTDQNKQKKKTVMDINDMSDLPTGLQKLRE